MKKFLFAMVLSASMAAGPAGTALAATSRQTPAAVLARPNHSDAPAPSNPMSGARMTAGGMMADRGGQSRTIRPMMAMMRMMMETGPYMAGHVSGSPMMSGS